MKRMMKRIGAFALGGVLGAATFIASTATAFAHEDNYTYNYDYWGDVQDSPDFYTVADTYTSEKLQLDERMANPQGMFVKGDTVYICDTDNNRILILEFDEHDKLTLKDIIKEFKGGVEVTTFAGPTDIAVSDEGEYFIADKGNHRILKLDAELNYLMQFDKPVDSTLDPEIPFQPHKIAIDAVGRVYCVASGINKGLVKYENDGTFSGFVGASKVTFDWTDYIWKKFATQEQRDRLVAFVPTEYDNLYMDHEGFIYAVIGNQDQDSLKNGDSDAIRRLNLLGNDILVQNGEWRVYGDLYMGQGGGLEGPSKFMDVTVMTNDVYVCLDQKRGRLFAYDEQGRMVFACGGPGNMNGYFKRGNAVDHRGYELLVLDSQDCSLTVMKPTEFGSLVYEAMYEFDQGEYEKSGEIWQEVMKLNGNYDLAYIGIGRSLLRQERYKEALDYFELKYDDSNYSKAFKQYRKEWVEENIMIIMVILLIVIIIPLVVGKIRAIKHEIDIADIFRI